MKVKIRRSVFETNSSSIHSLVLCSAEEYDGFKKGTFVYDMNVDRLVSIDSLSDEIVEEIRCGESEDYYTFKEYVEYIDERYDSFEDIMTTPNGEKVVAFGYYGYDC